ncbi:MAG: hypothetical protein ACP6IS_01610 [Candidatus Asgardarchaeia archaeon]
MQRASKKKTMRLREEVVNVNTLEIFFTKHASQRVIERCGLFFLENTLNYLRYESRFIFMKRKDALFLFVPTGVFLVGVFESPEKFIVKTTLYPSLYEKNEILRSNRFIVNVKEKTIVSVSLKLMNQKKEVRMS